MKIMGNLNLKLENVKLHTKLQNIVKEKDEQKAKYKQYVTDLKQEYEKNKNELEVLKQENETLKFKLNKLPKIIKWIFIGNEQKNVKFLGEGK